MTGPARPEPVRHEDMRVSDVERGEVPNRPGRAHDVGQLDLTEFDARLRSVWEAHTRGELVGTRADLPEAPPAPASRPDVSSDTGGGTAVRVLTIVWASIVAVNPVVWGIVSAANAGLLYRWWPRIGGPPGCGAGRALRGRAGAGLKELLAVAERVGGPDGAGVRAELPDSAGRPVVASAAHRRDRAEQVVAVQTSRHLHGDRQARTVLPADLLGRSASPRRRAGPRVGF